MNRANKKLTSIGVILLLVVLVLAFLSMSSTEKRNSRSVVRLKLNQNVGGVEYWDWDWFYLQTRMISNHFSAIETRRRIASEVAVEPDSFFLSEIQPTRGTALMRICFRAESSNTAWRVTEAASREIIRQYSGQTNVLVERVDGPLNFPLPTLWRRGLRMVEDIFNF